MLALQVLRFHKKEIMSTGSRSPSRGVKIVALVPSTHRPLPRADYNITLNDWYEWLSLLAATAG